MEYVGGGSARDLVSILYYCVFCFLKQTFVLINVLMKTPLL